MLTNVETPLVLRVGGAVFHMTETENCGEGNEWPEPGLHPSRALQREIVAEHGETVIVDGHNYLVNLVGESLELVLLGDESEMDL